MGAVSCSASRKGKTRVTSRGFTVVGGVRAVRRRVGCVCLSVIMSVVPVR